MKFGGVRQIKRSHSRKNGNLKRGETAIGLEGFVIVFDQHVLLLSLEYTEPSCHYLIGSTLGDFLIPIGFL